MLVLMSHHPQHLTLLWENTALDVYQVTSFLELNHNFLTEHNEVTGILIELSIAMQHQWDLLKSVATLTHQPAVFVGVVSHQAIPPHLQRQALAAGADAVLDPPLSYSILEGYLAAFTRRQASEIAYNEPLETRYMPWRRQGYSAPARRSEHQHHQTSLDDYHTLPPMRHPPSPHETSLSGNTFPAQSVPHQPSPLNNLTRREKQVLLHLVQGKSNADIAEVLSISRTTVKNHLAQVFRKLSVSNRTEAAYLAQQYGLMSEA